MNSAFNKHVAAIRQILPLIDSGGITVCTMTLAGFFGFAGWAFDMCSHFRLQYLVCLAICILLTLKREKSRLAVYLTFAFLNLIPIAILYIPDNGEIKAGPRLKVMSMNLDSIANKNYAKSVACIKSFDPDVISFQEINSSFAGYFAANLPEYKFSKMLTGEQCEGVGLLSKFPLSEATGYQVGYNFPIISAVVHSGLGDVQVIVSHPLPPAGWDYWKQEKIFFDAVTKMCEKRKSSFVVLGDLNATTYSYQLSRFRSEANLCDSCQGFGIQPSWPANCPPLWIDIDHCLFSNDLKAVARRIGPDVSSDHLPLFVELAARKYPYCGPTVR
jgi:endonuclease/exonuclease/phosphatase (EEP) superfamily protein YafD